MISFEVDNLINMNCALQTFLDYLSSNDVSDDDAFDCRLVSCELITNVVRHLGESALFYGRLCGDKIEITVLSKNSKNVNLEPSLPDVFAESGRGLYIINAICDGDVHVVANGIRACVKRNVHENKQ